MTMVMVGYMTIVKVKDCLEKARLEPEIHVGVHPPYNGIIASWIKII
jgi:hypothetical protein